MEEDWKSPKYTIVGSGDLLDVPIPTYREWVGRGYIPIALPAASQGRENKLSRLNLYQVECFKQLLKRGLSRESAKEIVKHIDGYDPQKPILIASLVDNTHMWAKKTESFKPIDFIIMLDISKIQVEVDKIFS